MRRSPESSGWNVAAQTGPSRHSTARSSCGREHLDARPDRLDHRRADEHAGEGAARDPGDVEWSLERLRLPAVRVSAGRDVQHTEGLLVAPAVDDTRREQDQAGTGPERRHPSPGAVRRAVPAGPTCRAGASSSSTRRRAAATRRPRRDRAGRAPRPRRRRARRAPHGAREMPPGAPGPRTSCSPGGLASPRPSGAVTSRDPRA